MVAATCGDCGSPMRQTFAYLTAKDGCQQIPTGLVCTTSECVERQRVQDRADQAARDQVAIERAIAAGVIDR